MIEEPRHKLPRESSVNKVFNFLNFIKLVLLIEYAISAYNSGICGIDVSRSGIDQI